MTRIRDHDAYALAFWLFLIERAFYLRLAFIFMVVMSTISNKCEHCRNYESVIVRVHSGYS